MLVDTKNLCIRDYLNDIRGSMLSMDDGETSDNMDTDGVLLTVESFLWLDISQMVSNIFLNIFPWGCQVSVSFPV